MKAGAGVEGEAEAVSLPEPKGAGRTNVPNRGAGDRGAAAESAGRGSAGSYTEALSYIHSLYRFGSRLGLGRIRRLLAALGDPHLGLRAIHIAGTNGKGSVAAMIASVLTAAGYRTGLYISPYLSDFSERISIDGRPIGREETAELVFGELIPAATKVGGLVPVPTAGGVSNPAPAGDEPADPLTEFEFVTALGFLYFARRGVDFVVTEVGLGGRFDATNVIDRPLAAVITSIGLDHTDRLGTTLAQIAAEKAGIIKRGAPVVSAPQDPEVLTVLGAAARRRDCPFYLAGRDGKVTLEETSLAGQRITYSGPGFPREQGLTLPLLGPHQLANAATALTALGVLRERGQAPALDGQALHRGLAATVWPGRFEVFGDGDSRRPIIVVDGAHNPPGAAALAETVRRLAPERKVLLVLGILGDKDVDTYLGLILPPALPQVAAVFTCRPDNPRAMSAAELEARVRRRAPGLPVEAAPGGGVEEALRAAWSAAGPGDLVLVAGSLYQVGQARAVARSLTAAAPGASSPPAAGGTGPGRQKPGP